jgi:hypothetical protein
VDHGCQNLGEVEFQYVGNFELLERRDAFLEMCRQCFLTAVNDAMKLRQRQAQDKGGVFELQRTGTLSKQQIMLFIETCTVTFQTDETRKRLRAAYEEGEASGKENGGETAASNACLILQYENMEKVGFDKVFGVQQLNGVVNTSMNDQQMMMKMSNFAQLCQEIVSTASISRVQFYMDQQRMIDAKVKQIEEEVADAETANLQTEGIMTRDQFMSFFNKNFELFELEETKTKLRNIARTSEGIADLNRVMVEMQKSQFAEVGVSRKVGNDSLGVLQSEFGDDQELMTLIKKFERKCSSVWIQAVKTAKTKKLQKNGRLSRLNLVNFLDGIKALLTTEESRTALRETYLSANREAAAQLSVKMQRDM